MKYARDSRTSLSSEETAQLLFEALPWMKNLTGKTVVIKYGGAAMVDERLRADVMSDIVLLKIMGMKPVIVHGGGKDINAALKRHEIPVEFRGGQRVTSNEAMELVREVLVGKVNGQLVSAVNQHGNLAVGVSGSDAGTIVAEQLAPELGRVGRIVRINGGYLNSLVENDYIPVVATVGVGEDGGFYNINADVAAGHIAAALGAHKVIFLTDVDGLYEDFSDKSSLISNLTVDETRAMLKDGAIDAGMIPKLESCIAALAGGVLRAHIINGTMPHSLLLELLTDAGIGTVIHASRNAYEYDRHPDPSAYDAEACAPSSPAPLDAFSARLTENS